MSRSLQVSSLYIRREYDLHSQSHTLVDCTGTAQAGVKWLKATGYNLPDTLRLTYNPHLQYMTITFTVSEQLQELLPIPSDSDFPKRWLYTFEPHYERCNTLFMLTWQDDEKSMRLLSNVHQSLTVLLV